MSDYLGQHRAPDKESGAPLYDVTLNWIYPDDVYSHNGLRYYVGDNPDERSAYHMVARLKGKQNANIAVFRAVPKDLKKGDINKGDWVTISRNYAKEHGQANLRNDFRIIKKRVYARDIFTDGNSLLEWGYDPQPRDEKYSKGVMLRKAISTLERLQNGEKIIMINKYPRDSYYNKDDEAINYYKNIIKKMSGYQKSQINEDYPSNFSMEEFNSIKSYAGKKRYALERLKRLGAGSSRMVFQIDKEKALKLAINKKGLAQNNVETDGYFGQMDITADVFDYDDKHEYPYWVEMELAIPVNRKQKMLEKLLGLKMEELEMFLKANNPNERSAGSYIKSIKPERMEELWEHEYASQLIDLVGNMEMQVGDLVRPSSWGVVKRNGKLEPVLIDFGFTNDVRLHYYA